MCGEALEQVVQRVCECCLFGSVQCQVEGNFEQAVIVSLPMTGWLERNDQ